MSQSRRTHVLTLLVALAFTTISAVPAWAANPPATRDFESGICADAQPDRFADVPTSGEEAEAINCLASLGSRAQTATLLQRGNVAIRENAVAGHQPARLPAGDDYYRDGDGSVHEASIDAVSGAGALHGTAEGNFQPRGTLTRGSTRSRNCSLSAVCLRYQWLTSAM